MTVDSTSSWIPQCRHREAACTDVAEQLLQLHADQWFLYVIIDKTRQDDES